MEDIIIKSCEICNGELKVKYLGSIRDGSYGNSLDDAVILECQQCNVQRLKEEYCIPDSYYESGAYREILNQSLETNKAIYEQNEIQKYTFNEIPLSKLKDKVIMDVGCGAGSLLNMTKNISNKQIGVEPCQPYRDSLIAQGYEIFRDLTESNSHYHNTVDYAFSIQVIEHVSNPREFLEEIKSLIKPGGSLLLSTPNCNEILMSIMYEEFSSFFYRTQHKWYFNEESLIKCAKLSGFDVEQVSFVHRQPLSNALFWLKDKQPKGSLEMAGINSDASELWKAYLENTKQSCTIYLKLKNND